VRALSPWHANRHLTLTTPRTQASATLGVTIAEQQLAEQHDSWLFEHDYDCFEEADESDDDV
jgi:hypothetical protein